MFGKRSDPRKQIHSRRKYIEEYANYIGDDPYCDDCYDGIKGHPIHDYSYKPDPIFYGRGKRYFGVELEIDVGGRDDDNAQLLLDMPIRVTKKSTSSATAALMTAWK